MTIDETLVRDWLTRKMDADSIRTHLYAAGHDDSMVDAYLSEFRKARNAKRQFNGFILLAAGAILGFISCVLTIINPLPSLHDFFLYGFTSVSIIILCWGLYWVFE